MADHDLPTLWIDRRKLTDILKFHIRMTMHRAGYTMATIANMVEEYCISDNATVAKVVDDLMAEASPATRLSINNRLVEPTVGDLGRFRRATHYTVQVADDIPEEVKAALHAYLADHKEEVK